MEVVALVQVIELPKPPETVALNVTAPPAQMDVGVTEFVAHVGSATTVHDVVVSADSHPLTDVTARDLILYVPLPTDEAVTELVELYAPNEPVPGSIEYS